MDLGLNSKNVLAIGANAVPRWKERCWTGGSPGGQHGTGATINIDGGTDF